MNDRIQAESVVTGPGAGAQVAGPGRRGAFLRYLPLAIVLGAALCSPAAVSAQTHPCMDGVLFGDLTKFYRAIYDSQYTTMNVYATLDPEEKAMVDCGKDQVGPDINRYKSREIVNDNTGVIGRLWEYYDTTTYTYYMVAALEGCYSDTVMGRSAAGLSDRNYLRSVHWDVDRGHTLINGSDQVHAQFDCGAPSPVDMTPWIVDLEFVTPSFGSSTEPDTAEWTAPITTPSTTSARMPQMVANTSMVWNLEFRKTFLAVANSHASRRDSDGDGIFGIDLDWYLNSANWTVAGHPTGPDPYFNAASLGIDDFEDWDIEDFNNDNVDERPNQANDAKSPFACNEDGANPDDATCGDALFGANCDAACQALDYGTKWFDSKHMWDWGINYEMSWRTISNPTQFDTVHAAPVKLCTSENPASWLSTFDNQTHSSPAKSLHNQCNIAANVAEIVLVKDVEPDPAVNEWAKFQYNIWGPTIGGFRLQNPAKATTDPLFGTSPWEYPDKVRFEKITATQIFGGTYQVVESSAPGSSTSLEEYTVSWICKNSNKANAACQPTSASFNFDNCPAVVVPAACSSDPDWTTDGVVSGSCSPGVAACSTSGFPVCTAATVICEFTNTALPTEPVCLESVNTVGDLLVLGGIVSEQTSFTTAAVSGSQSDGPDSIFLASFTPIDDQSRWPGTIDSFVQPLPVVADEDGHLLPDKSETCDDDDDTGCLSWDTGEEILEQAPDSTQVVTDRQIGMNAAQRRVTYSQATAAAGTVPLSIRAFNYGGSDLIADERDLWDGLGIPYVLGDTLSESAARLAAANVIRQTLAERTRTFTDPDTEEETTVTYVLGDIFHGDPQLLGGPSNFFYLANDLEGNGQACSVTGSNANKGYRCFFEKERRRRKVLLAPSNDGQLHAFDAGFFQSSVQHQKQVGNFDAGTGRELFAHIPRQMLAHTKNMVTLEHATGIDGAITLDDVFIDPAHSGTPTSSEREWRTVAIGAYRDGGRGLYALDLTQPDPVTPHTVLNFAGVEDVEYTPVATSSAVPECSAVASSLPSGCSAPYPSVLWEWTDTAAGLSWSKVNTGRVLVRLTSGGTPVVKFVAIFGGGIDPADAARGQNLYMVDIETGKTLWKRAVTGAVPSEPAAVDTDQNGLIDTIYVGTAAGFMYKVNVSQAADVNSTTQLVDNVTQWAPFRIFDTGGRPIFFRPTVVYDSSSGHYALAFGTGDRENLWSDPSVPGGRFYMVLDSGFAPGVAPIASGPLTESNFPIMAADDDPVSGNLILAPGAGKQSGWVLELGDDERVVTDALTVSGLLAFTTFDPQHPDICEFGGNGNIYALLATNANAISGGDSERAIAIEGFAGKPVITSEGFTRQDGQGNVIDPFESADIDGVRQSLMSLFPADCRFGNFSLNVSTSLSSQEVLPLAQIPVCIARKNWTEH